jgi:hypothetical protein
VVTYDMVGIGAVKVSTRPNAWQDWLAVKNGDGKCFLVELALPRYALLRPILDNQGSVHPTGLALEVFTLAFMRIDLPCCTASAAQSNIVIHPIILAFNDSGQVALKLQSYLTESAMPIFCDLHYHPALLPIKLVLGNGNSVKQNNSICILLNST